MATVKEFKDAYRTNMSEAATRKRKRNELAMRSSSPVAKLTPASSFSSSVDDEEEIVSTPTNQLLEVVENDRVSGAASPRMIAAGELSRLSIDESLESQSSKYDSKKGKDSPRRESASSMSAEDDENGPPSKKVPRGISSPKPKFRRFSLPEKKSKEISTEEGSDSHTDSPKATPETEEGNIWDFDFSSMTWQDSEITGHLMLDSDDDGTGINGIGFKPTPSIARQRAAQRRRQVQEWRMRQEREEREHRAERRRIHANSMVSSLSERVDVKKAVRFTV